MRGACVLTALANYRKALCSGDLPCDVFGSKKRVLCSTGFKYHLHSCRIPKKHKDSYRIYDPYLNKHCIVACRGHFFSMDIVDDDNNVLPFDALEGGLERCIDLAKEKTMPQLGYLTTSDRDTCAKNRDLLIRAGGKKMLKALERIESSVALICLDETNTTKSDDFTNEIWHGGYGLYMNRWFDKPVQLICESNGRVAYYAEHSMLDGMQRARLCHDIDETQYETLSNVPVDRNVKIPFVYNVFEDTVNEKDEGFKEIHHAIQKGEHQEVWHFEEAKWISIDL